jgi:DNA-binding MarR family transcriptional regulator
MGASGDDLEEVLGRFLQRRNRMRLYRGMLTDAPDGVDKSNYPVLSGLERLGPRTAAQLALEVGLDRSRVSRHADRFEELGLLRRAPDPLDGRGSLLVLTAAGEAAVADLRGALARHLDQVIADWPDGLADAVVEGLGRLMDRE